MSTGKLLVAGLLAVWLMGGGVALAARGNIKLRVVAVNPSAEKSQKVPIKIYLPKEVIPDDIIDMGELKVGYDSEKSMYFAFSEGVELAPQETRIFEVQLEDVWRIPSDETDKIRTQTARALKHLESTEYFDKAKVIVDSIERRLTEIQVKQDDDSISREEHIGAYRVNQIIMTQIKQDVQTLEKLLQHTGAPPSIEFLKDTVFEEKKDLDKITAWRIIFGIIGFIMLLGLGLYVRWFFALKARKTKVASAEAEDSLLHISEHVEEHVGIHTAPPGDKAADKTVNPDQEKRKAG